LRQRSRQSESAATVSIPTRHRCPCWVTICGYFAWPWSRPASRDASESPRNRACEMTWMMEWSQPGSRRPGRTPRSPFGPITVKVPKSRRIQRGRRAARSEKAGFACRCTTRGAISEHVDDAGIGRACIRRGAAPRPRRHAILRPNNGAVRQPKPVTGTTSRGAPAAGDDRFHRRGRSA
jgi:hypothetical protein